MRAALLSAVAALAFVGGAAAPAPASAPTPATFQDPEYAMGAAKAQVTVVEYLSNTCSHCADYDLHVFPQVKKAYIDTGKVRYVVREFLTPPEPVSAAGFVFARCGGRERYWDIVEGLFRSQEELFRTGDVRATYLKVAKSVGLPEARFDACMKDDAAFKAVGERADKAMAGGVNGTPTFVFNGKMLKPGARLGGAPYAGGELTFAQFQAAYRAAGGR